jgi:hypothetical protein
VTRDPLNMALGKRSLGRPKKRWENILKMDMEIYIYELCKRENLTCYFSVGTEEKHENYRFRQKLG